MKLTQPRLGWFNYQHLYQSNVFNEIIDSLTSPLWDKSRMRNIIKENPKNGIDAGSTLDMMCKIHQYSALCAPILSQIAGIEALNGFLLISCSAAMLFLFMRDQHAADGS